MDTKQQTKEQTKETNEKRPLSKRERVNLAIIMGKRRGRLK